MDLSEESNDSKPETKERRSRDRYTRKDRRSRDRDSKYSRRDRDRDRDREREREKERKSRRSLSRERRRSRSPRRERSRSRDRPRKYTKRYERKNQSDKAEVLKLDEDKRNNPSDGDRFFMPGITGRFRDQIERRKQLWQKKDTNPTDNKNGQSKKVWETTTFAQDTDGKVASKFKRLMGIKGATDGAGSTTDVLKKQEEMFSSMEQQYEVARTATHTMRGVGLGFGSFQR
ncbi:arginine/serine-rich coiled-coil protein 2 isoform X2 [Tribolium castaneum]